MACNRDEQAYKQLFKHFYSSLHRFCTGIVKDEELAEEIVSDVLLKIWQLETKLLTVERLDLYLFQSVKNAAFTQLSKNKINAVEIKEEEFEQVYSNDVEERIILKQTGNCIDAAVTHLPAQCQTVFRLIKDEGLSYKEVQKIMGLSNNTIKTHIRIALKRIKEALAQSDMLKN